jgi:hypothetical protein
MLAEAALLAVLSVERGPGAEACVGDAQLKRSVERRLKRRVFVADSEASLRVRISFIAREPELEARIELSSIDGTPRGTRSLVTTGHCSALDDSLALSVALLVDEPPEPIPRKAAEMAAEPTAPNGTSAKSAPTPSPTSRHGVISIPPEVAAPREPWHLRVGAAAKAAWGPLPGLRPAAVLALTLVPRNFVPIRLQGEAFSSANAERDASSGARFHLLRVGLALCPPLWEGSQGAVGLCVGQQLGWLNVEGYGFDHDLKEQRLGYSLTLGGEGRLRLFPPVSVRGYLGGEAALIRDRFGSGGRNASELFQPHVLAVVGEIGLEAALW